MKSTHDVGFDKRSAGIPSPGGIFKWYAGAPLVRPYTEV